MSAADLAGRLLAGDTRALARAISLVEDRSDEAPALLTFETKRELVERAAREIGWTLHGSAAPAAAGAASHLADKGS